MLSSASAETVHELRVASGIVTTMTFEDTAIDVRALTLEGRGSRVKLVGADEHTVVLKPLVELARGERLLLRVAFTDGQSPTRATFALVSHPSEVDFQIEVVREARSAEACQAELGDLHARLARKDAELAACTVRAEANGPAGLVLTGLLGMDDLKRSNRIEVPVKRVEASGLVMEKGWVGTTRAWAVMAVRVMNHPGQSPWKPEQATLTSTRTREAVKVRGVRMQEPTISPGEAGLVVVETEALSRASGNEFSLEVWDATTGRRLVLPSVKIENPK